MVDRDNTLNHCVLYAMSRSTKVNESQALLAAQSAAITHNLPLAAVYCLKLEENINHEKYQSLLAELEESEATLRQLNIPFVMLIGDPLERLLGMIHHTTPIAVYFDESIKNESKVLTSEIKKQIECDIYIFDSQQKSTKTLVQHPVTWPGSVISIEQLRGLF